MRFAIVLTLLSHAAVAQPAFEAASVKPAGPASYKEGQANVVFSPGSLTLRSATLQSIIAMAYSVRDFQVSGTGLNSERYDILAKAAGGAGDDQLKLMLQGLLADRFKLTLHRESKETPVYALVVGKKGPRLSDAAQEGSGGMKLVGGDMIFQGYSVSKLIDFLAHLRSADRPVLDMTGIQGLFDFKVHFADISIGGMAESKRAAEQAFQDPSLAASIVEQLGLKLEPRRAPIETIVVDHVERPGEN
jgi:uncharacterized protein (TIGR03435 family)